MDVIIIGGGIGGLTLALAAACSRRGPAHPGVRGRAGDPPARRRHQSRAARRQGAERARAAGRARGGFLPAAGLRVLHPPRPARLSRAVGDGRRPSVAALFDPPRRSAPGAAGRACSQRLGAEKLHHRPSLHRRRAGRRAASPRALPRPTARRCRRKPATCWSPATASIRWCGRSSIRTKARSSIAASICGAA